MEIYLGPIFQRIYVEQVQYTIKKIKVFCSLLLKIWQIILVQVFKRK